jgi:Ca-activated chloride channel family protein
MPATLQTLAHRTNGQYANASTLQNADGVRALLAKTVATGRKGRVSNEANSVKTERFQWFLLPAVLFGLISLAIEFPRWPKPRQVRRVDTALLLLLTFGLSTNVRAHFDSQAEFEVREVLDSNPVQRLRAIAEHLARFDYDAFDMRLMVEETIKYGVDSQRTGTPPSEGVIRDGIEACLQGKKLNPSIADWSYYHAQLTAMLAPLENSAGQDESSAKRKELMDEEDTPPSVAGDSTQQSASDSFGQGAATKTDAALGELSTDQKTTPQRKKPTPPKRVHAATLTGSNSGGSDNDDPILALSKKRLDDAVRNDSPGRVHQLLAGSTEEQTSDQPDW